MTRIALGIEYDGSQYCGWQTQPHAPNIQDCVQQALGQVADHPVTIHAAGRTDAGVHAIEQVAHFDTESVRPSKAWTMGANQHLAPDISIRWATEVDDEFHSRWSATSRSYVYLLHTGACRSALLARRAGWCKQSLNVSEMNEAAQHLIGENDFSSFRAAECQSNTPMRNVHRIDVTETGGLIRFEITANAFLHHMVRNIVGALMRVGRGNEDADWVGEVLRARDRRVAGATAEPQGLYLAKIRYPEQWALPGQSADPSIADSVVGGF